MSPMVKPRASKDRRATRRDCSVTLINHAAVRGVAANPLASFLRCNTGNDVKPRTLNSLKTLGTPMPTAATPSYGRPLIR
jgi:hypothetical protein